MINIKRLILFVVSFFVIYGLMSYLVPKLGVDIWYHNQFKSWGNTIFGEWGGNGKVEFLPGAMPVKEKSRNPFKQFDQVTMVKILNQDQIDAAIAEARRVKATKVNVSHAEFFIDTWQFAMIPLIFVSSLILASPVPILRRFLALGIGLVLMQSFLLFRFWIRFVIEINRHGWLEVGSLSPKMIKVFANANTIFMFIGVSMFVSVLIWIVSTFRRSDLNLFIIQDDEE